MEKILSLLVYIGEVGIYLAPIIYIGIIYFKNRVMEAKKLLDMQNALYYMSHLDNGKLSNSLLKEKNSIMEEGEESELWAVNEDTVDDSID